MKINQLLILNFVNISPLITTNGLLRSSGNKAKPPLFLKDFLRLSIYIHAILAIPKIFNNLLFQIIYRNIKLEKPFSINCSRSISKIGFLQLLALVLDVFCKGLNLEPIPPAIINTGLSKKSFTSINSLRSMRSNIFLIHQLQEFDWYLFLSLVKFFVYFLFLIEMKFVFITSDTFVDSDLPVIRSSNIPIWNGT